MQVDNNGLHKDTYQTLVGAKWRGEGVLTPPSPRETREGNPDQGGGSRC